MPITFAHPAAAVPFVRFGLPLSALVVGSMMPDLPYFLHLTTSADYAHTMRGQLTFCLPAGMATLWVFHQFLKHPLLWLAPPSHQRKLAFVARPFRWTPLPRLLMICLAVLIGSLSHVLWDAFSHVNGWFVVRMPMLAAPALTTALGTVPVYKLVQYGSSVAGTAVLVWLYQHWYANAREHELTPPAATSERFRRVWIGILLVTPPLLASAYALMLNGSVWTVRSLYMFPRDFVLMFGIVFAVLLLVCSLLWHLQAHRSVPLVED